jgi:cysteine desulfuration protein SufE
MRSNQFLPLARPLKQDMKKIIELGRQLPPFNPAACTPANLVPGCQSIMYLEASLDHGRLMLNADSEALISKGLAALLIRVYSGRDPCYRR